MQVFNKEDVTNVLLFTGGLDSVLSYLKLRKETPNFQLVYSPIYVKGTPKFIDGEVSTLKLMNTIDRGILDHPVYFFNSAARAWDTMYVGKSDTTYIPYKEPIITMIALLTYPNTKNVWIGTLADGINMDEYKENMKKLQIVIRDIGKNKDFSIKSAFNWKKYKYEAIKELITKAKDSPEVVYITKSILYAYSSYTFTNVSMRMKVRQWITARLHKMRIDPNVKVGLNSVLNANYEIPAVDRRGYNSVLDLLYNAAIYNGLGIVLPMFNLHLLDRFKAKALDINEDMESKERKAILNYINAFTELDSRYNQ